VDERSLLRGEKVDQLIEVAIRAGTGFGAVVLLAAVAVGIWDLSSLRLGSLKKLKDGLDV